MLSLPYKDIEKIVLVGDRVLCKPSKPPTKTDTGLYLPEGLHKKDPLFTGYVMKVGPGYPIPAIQEDDDFWKERQEQIKYVPLQPKPGDLAVYLQQNVYEIVFNRETYVIVPHAAILLLIRDE